jgi:hypothetical protein
VHVIDYPAAAKAEIFPLANARYYVRPDLSARSTAKAGGQDDMGAALGRAHKVE